jgi:hypothetical protein
MSLNLEEATMTREQSVRFDLRMRGGTQGLLGFSVIVAGVMALVFIKWSVGYLTASSYGTAFVLVCFALMFGALAANGVLSLTLKDDAGYLEVREDGIVLDTFMSIGQIPWANFAGIDVITVNNGNNVLGISLKDPAAYLASRQSMQGTKSKQLEQHKATMRALYAGATTALAPLTKPLAMINQILGKRYFDTSGEEAHLMESNKSQNGHHILIPAYWFADASVVVASVGRWRR